MFINQIAPNHFYLKNYYFFSRISLATFSRFFFPLWFQKCNRAHKSEKKKGSSNGSNNQLLFFRNFYPRYALRASSVYRENFSNIFFFQNVDSEKNTSLLPMTIIIFYRTAAAVFSITRTSYDLHPCVKFAKLRTSNIYWKMTLLLNYCRS